MPTTPPGVSAARWNCIARNNLGLLAVTGGRPWSPEALTVTGSRT